MNPAIQLGLLIGALLIGGCGQDVTSWRRAPASDAYAQLALSQSSEILSAFFGADDVPPGGALAACSLPLTMRIDGLPVTFQREIDQSTLQASDFSVTLQNGDLATPLCATTAPASEENEDRTVLLGGQFGGGDNPPVSVSVIGDLWTEGSATVSAGNLNAQTASVVSLADGPSVVLAEMIPNAELEVSAVSSTLGPSCPGTTVQAVKLTWQGGVTRNGRQEITDFQRRRYKVTMQTPQGGTTSVTPFAIGDLNDQDNIQDLCLNVTGAVISVQIPAGTVTDPVGDPNPEIDIVVANADSGT